jgi:hypothetical protein
LQHYKAVAAV